MYFQFSDLIGNLGDDVDMNALHSMIQAAHSLIDGRLSLTEGAALLHKYAEELGLSLICKVTDPSLSPDERAIYPLAHVILNTYERQGASVFAELYSAAEEFLNGRSSLPCTATLLYQLSEEHQIEDIYTDIKDAYIAIHHADDELSEVFIPNESRHLFAPDLLSRLDERRDAVWLEMAQIAELHSPSVRAICNKIMRKYREFGRSDVGQ